MKKYCAADESRKASEYMFWHSGEVASRKRPTPRLDSHSFEINFVVGLFSI